MGAREEISWEDVKRMLAELVEQSKETDRRMQETDRRIEAMRAQQEEALRRLERQLGKLGNRLGDFVEGLVEPAVVKLFRARGLPVNQVLRRLEAVNESGELICEVDLLVIDSDVAVAVECKSHAGIEEVREHLARLDKFKDAFPRFADLRLQGAIAAMHWTRDAQRFAYSQGLWVLAQNGEIVEVKNDARFTPRCW
ncbi:MAG: hypothetical protein N2441_09515 [Rhodocyclaceae bacterium]|nr:hypothetical protein [Rhodocyclaceae bacterium]